MILRHLRHDFSRALSKPDFHHRLLRERAGPGYVALGMPDAVGVRRGVLSVKRLIKMTVVPVVQAGKVEIRMKCFAVRELSRG